MTPIRRSLVALSIALCHAYSVEATAGDADTTFAGRRLTDVLEHLRAGGLPIVYSSAVVGPDLVVAAEPIATEPRAILDEILARFALQARTGPGGSILILPAEGREGALRGRVLSAARASPVVGAMLRIDGRTDGATTGPDGSFVLRGVPHGMHDVTTEATGFLTATTRGVSVRPDETTDLVVRLRAFPTLVTEIVVTPGSLSVLGEEAAPTYSVGDEEAILVPTIGGDVSRVIDLLPGVAAPDNSGSFSVRGSLARDVALVLDGLELYEPFHLREFQSPFSFIDNEIVERIDVHAGSLTSEFGDRHGGVVELSTSVPEGGRRGAVELGSLRSRLEYGSPFASAPGSWLVSARAWYPELLRDTIELGEVGIDPRFQDVYAKASRTVSSKTSVSAHALLAHDRFEFTESDGRETVASSSRSAYVWIRALRAPSPGRLSDTIVSTGRLDLARRGLSEPEDELVTVDDERKVTFVGVKHDSSWHPSERHLVKTGVEARRLSAEYRYASGPAGASDPARFERLFPEGTSIGAYAAYRTALSARWTTEFGIRWDRQSQSDDGQLSPRAHAVWRTGDRSELRLGAALAHQSHRIHELAIEDGETTFRPAERSRQLDLSFRHRTRGGVRLVADAYVRDLSRLRPRSENLFDPLQLYPETEEDRVFVAPSRARLRGVELLVHGEPERRFIWWTSYTLSSADDVVEGRDVPRSWDQTHAGKLLVGYRPSERWFVSLSASAHTGWPTTPVSAVTVELPDGSTATELVLGPRNAARFPGYARFDVKASRSYRFAGSRLRLDFEVVNLANRDNTCCIDDFIIEQQPSGAATARPEFDSWLGITPSFSVLWEF